MWLFESSFFFLVNAFLTSNLLSSGILIDFCTNRSGELDSVVKMNAATEALEAKEKVSFYKSYFTCRFNVNNFLVLLGIK